VRFEAFTLGTLAIIVVVGVVGYALGAPVRRAQAAPVDPLGAIETPPTEALPGS
jgi:hypothetical protein